MARTTQTFGRGSERGRMASSESGAQSGRKTDDLSESAQEMSSSEGGQAKASSGASFDLADFQDETFESLRAILDKRADDDADTSTIAEEFAAQWLPLLVADREVLVPALRKSAADETKSAAVRVRKDIVNALLAELIGGDGSEAIAKTQLDALADALNRYEKSAQQERKGLKGVLAELGPKMKNQFERAKPRFADLDDDLGEAMDLLAPRSLSLFPRRQRSAREFEMPRYSSNTPDRDEQGRFVSDDDRGGSRGGGRGRSGGPERDEEGRFMSSGSNSRDRYDDDDRNRGRSSRGREDDDDRRYSSRHRDDDDRRHGGWFGDSEGHAEASRRGWQRSDRGDSGWYGDSEGHSEASRRGWQRSDHGDNGWRGDPEGHSEASRRGWQRSDRGESGWYGDAEGHSEAARRGWEGGQRSQRRDEGEDDRGRRRDDDNGRYESRRGREDDDRRSYSRGREDEDDRRYSRGRYEDDNRQYSRSREDDDDRRSSSRGRGHGGWSGDPEGHSEASRRGWENRR